MTSSALIAIAAALCIALSTIAPAIAQGMTASKAMDAIARQPEAAGDIRSTLILSMGLMEALTIYGLLIALMLVAKI
ncbi:MAG: ATP synthase F0 subunit C [Oscillospiraceae bacterium]|nr:ATP synthase F0 subunit C [Oscillospiraceae bacterium]